MKESHTEGLASHGDLESCAYARKGVGEALTEAHMGGVLSRENKCQQGADGVLLSGRQHTYARKGESTSNPARSETSSTYGNSMCENREIPCLPFGGGSKGRAGKVNDRNPAMHGQGKSDNPIIPAKLPNKAGRPAAEAVEVRDPENLFGAAQVFSRFCHNRRPP
jgi:RNA-directed DNA polymerase